MLNYLEQENMFQKNALKLLSWQHTFCWALPNATRIRLIARNGTRKVKHAPRSRTSDLSARQADWCGSILHHDAQQCQEKARSRRSLNR